MTNIYRIAFGFLCLFNATQAIASKELMDEQHHPNTHSKPQPEDAAERKEQLKTRLFWLYEKNPSLSSTQMEDLVKNAYKEFNLPYPDQITHAAPAYGCLF